MFENFSFLLAPMILAFAIWSIYERRLFTRFEGKLKRGIMIWIQPMTWEVRQFLETLPAAVRNGKRFIRKEGREILISEERPWWGRNSWYYIAYVDLNAPDNRLEFRMPASSLAGLILPLLIFPLFFFAFFLDGDLETDGFPFFFLLPILFILVISMGSLMFSHYQERKRLLSILDEAGLKKGFDLADS